MIADDGKVLVYISGLKLRKTNPEAIFGNGKSESKTKSIINSKLEQKAEYQKEDIEDWLYEIEWCNQGNINQVGVNQVGVNQVDKNKEKKNKLIPDYFPEPLIVRDNLQPNLEKSLTRPELKTYQEFLPQLEELSIAYVLNAIDSLIVNLNNQFIPGTVFSIPELIQKLEIVPQHQQLFKRLLEMLVESGYIQFSGEQFQVVKQPPIEEHQTKYQNLLTQYPTAKAELTLLHRCGISLAGVLQGKIDPLQLLFPQGDLSPATQLYQDSPGAKLMNSLVQQVVESLLENKPQNQTVRILEIGAGTGGTTAYLLPILDTNIIEYTFSDVSPLFLDKAKQKFAEYNFVEYQTLQLKNLPLVKVGNCNSMTLSLQRMFYTRLAI